MIVDYLLWEIFEHSNVEIVIFCQDYYSTIAADILAPFVTRVSAVMILNLKDDGILELQEEGFQLHVPS